MDFQEVGRQREAISKTMIDMIDNDRRTRMLIDYAYAEAREKMGRHIDPENADQDAHDLAKWACWFLASRIFTEDAELAAIRIERDHYKKLAERALHLSPSPMMVLKSEA